MSTANTQKRSERTVDGASFFGLGLDLAQKAGPLAPMAAKRVVSRFAHAGTGRPIGELSGAVVDRAVKAWFGGGPEWKGGRGMAGGEKVLEALKSVPTGLYVAGAITMLVAQVALEFRRDGAQTHGELETVDGVAD